MRKAGQVCYCRGMNKDLEAALIDWAKSAYPDSGAVFNHLILMTEKAYPVEGCSVRGCRVIGEHVHNGPVTRGARWAGKKA